MFQIDIVKNLGRAIYDLIQENNMTCQEFGEALEYSVTDVDRIIFGEVLLPPIEIKRIANLFGITKLKLLNRAIELESED